MEEASGLKTVSRALIALPIDSCWVGFKDVATGDIPVAIPTEMCVCVVGLGGKKTGTNPPAPRLSYYPITPLVPSLKYNSVDDS